MDNEPSVLSFVTTEEIISELTCRFGNILLVTEHKENEDLESMQIFTVGGIMPCLGMAQYANIILLRKATGDILFDKCPLDPEQENQEE